MDHLRGNLPEGESDYEPLQLEVSTAEGDSGGPHFLHGLDGKWRGFWERYLMVPLIRLMVT